MARAAAAYHFRPRMRTETAAAYRVALIDYVERRDFTMAHEVRTGKPHTEWTAVEIAQLRQRVTEIPPPRKEFSVREIGEGLAFLPMIASPPGTSPATEEDLEKLAEAGLRAIMERRVAEPGWNIPILISVLLMDGSVLTTSGVERADRVAVVKHIARNAPVFGYFIAADMILHTLGDATAARTEGIMMHIGTREMRIARVAAYTRTAAGIVFDEPYNIDKREGGTIQDPYAEIFVSVPPPAGPPA
jgi:hypothetical protein